MAGFRFLAQIYNPSSFFLHPSLFLVSVWIIHFYFTRNLYARTFYSKYCSWKLIGRSTSYISKSKNWREKWFLVLLRSNRNSCGSYENIFSLKDHRIYHYFWQNLWQYPYNNKRFVFRESSSLRFYRFYIVFFFIFIYFFVIHPPSTVSTRETWSFRHRPSHRIHTEVANLKTTSRYYDGRKWRDDWSID